MKHRSPLVTLAGLVVAFVIMLAVNMASTAPRDSYAGPPSATPPSATATGATAAASTPAPEPSGASPTASDSESTAPPTSEFPDKVVYAGRTKDGSAAIAVAVLGDKAAAYLCDGRDVESWLSGTVVGDTLALKSKGGAALKATLTDGVLTGTIDVDEPQAFAIKPAKAPAGLYRAKGSKSTIGWIVLPDGSQVGIQTSDGTSAAAPELDPDNPTVTADGEQLSAEPVTGDEAL